MYICLLSIKVPYEKKSGNLFKAHCMSKMNIFADDTTIYYLHVRKMNTQISKRMTESLEKMTSSL